MVFQSVSPTNSNASNLNQINDLARTVASSERTQIFKDDAGTRRVLLGKGLNDFYGLKVSPVGTDVYDAADADLIFNSNQNVFKILKTGSLSMPSASVTAGDFLVRTQTATFPTQTQAPAVIAFGKGPFSSGLSLWSGIKMYAYSVGAGTGINPAQIDVLDTNITTSSVEFISTYINGDGLSQTAPAYTITYYILQESVDS